MSNSRQFFTQAALVNASGVATFTFPPTPLGSVMTGTISVYDSPPGANWLVTVAGTPAGTAVGVAPLNNVQQWQNETLIVTASNLTPGQIYHCAFNGVLDDATVAEVVQPSSPAVNPSQFSVLARLAPTVVTLTQTTGPIAVNNAGAIGLQITNGDNVNANPISCSLQWLASDATTVLFTETWFMFGSTLLFGHNFLDVFPPMGAYLKLSISPNAVTRLSYTLWGAGLGASFERPAPTLLFSTNPVLVAANSSVDFVLGSSQATGANIILGSLYWPSDVKIWINSSAGVNVSPQMWNGAGWVDIFQLSTPAAGGASPNADDVFTMGRSSIQLDIHNTSSTTAFNVFTGLVSQR